MSRPNPNNFHGPETAPYGHFRLVKTPWGAYERCSVVSMPMLDGSWAEYASVYMPRTNPGVRWSVFEIKEDAVHEVDESLYT